MNSIDSYIKENYTMDYILLCNSVPVGLSHKVTVEENTKINSKWRKKVTCPNGNIYNNTRDLFSGQNILFNTKITQKETILASLLYVKRGESFVGNIIWGIIKWILIAMITMFSPLHILKYSAAGIGSKLQYILKLF